MKKIKILILILASFFCTSFATDPLNKPQWFMHYKMINATPYPIVVTTRFTDYKTPLGHDLGLLINPGSNSDEAEFFDSPPLMLSVDSFAVFAPVSMKEQYIIPSGQIFFDNKDYTFGIVNQTLVPK